VLKQSRRFDVNEGDMVTVLGCLKPILEMSVTMNPNLEKGGGEPVELHSNYDLDMDLDNNDQVPQPESQW
jgi:hypothetical protein